MRELDRAGVRVALTALGQRLLSEGISADLYVVGGAALALAYDERRATRDVDGVFVPKAEVYAAAAAVGEELGLEPDWLNDGVKGFLTGQDRYPTQVLDLPGLRVEIASPQAVLVLKALAHRVGEDDDDLRLLARRLDLSAEQVLDLVEEAVGAARVSSQTVFFVQAVLDEDRGGASGDEVAW